MLHVLEGKLKFQTNRQRHDRHIFGCVRAFVRACVTKRCVEEGKGKKTGEGGKRRKEKNKNKNKIVTPGRRQSTKDERFLTCSLKRNEPNQKKTKEKKRAREQPHKSQPGNLTLTAKLNLEDVQLLVIWPKVVAPFTAAVGLVDH